MIRACATIRNTQGIHCRPSGLIASFVKRYPGSIEIAARAGCCNNPSVLSLMKLGLRCGDRVDVGVSGPDETRRCEELVSLLETEFDFPPR